MGAAGSPDQDPRKSETKTLGDLLYGDTTRAVVSEKDWIGLIRSIATGDQLALRTLYEQAHRIVYTLAVRITKLLATDTEKNLVSMLVRLAPGTDYPAHRHAGVEELHLLEGVLRVDDRTFQPGDYLRSEPGTVDHRVWSETGCTCFLLTSYNDALF